MTRKRQFFSLLTGLTLALAPILDAHATGWTGKLTLTSVSDVDFQGEVVLFAVNQAVDNSAGCTGSSNYAIRDANTIKGALALLTTAFITGIQVTVYVTGACDSSGVPSVNSVTISN